MWKTVKLGDVCTIYNGGTPNSKTKTYWEGDIKWLTPKDMGKLDVKFVSDTARKITHDGLNNSSAKIVPANSVILSCRAPIGHVFMNECDMSFNQGCKGLVPSNEILVEYLYYFLFSSKQLLNDLGTGTTFKEISSKTLSNVSFSYPPLAEQGRIVAKIDAAFAKIDEVVNAVEAKEIEVQKLKASLLSSSLNGDAKVWKTLKLDDIASLTLGKTPSRGNQKFWDKEKNSKNIWLSIADLSASNQLYIEDSKEYLSDEGAKLFKEVPAETLIMSFKLSIGKLAITKCALRTNEAIIAMPIKDEKLILKEYLYYFLSSMNWDAVAGNDIKVKGKTLNKAKLKEFPILVPPLPEQERIVAKLDAAYSQFKNAKESIAKSKANYLALKTAILKEELQSSKAA